MVRLLVVALFLALEGVTFALGHWLMKASMRSLGTGRSGSVLGYTITVAMVAVEFLQFWILTGFFSWGLLLLLAVTMMGQWLIVQLLGAVSGVAVPERQTKIQVLNVIWGMQDRVAGCFFLASAYAALGISAFGSLWVYWTTPFGSDEARLGIALFMFIVPAVLLFPATLAVGWSAATSPFLDDDVRTSRLIWSLSQILRNMVYWLFPVWLFRAEFSNRFPNLPPFWALLSLPLMAFVVTGLLPFFLGAYRFRSQSRDILHWRKQWIADWLRTLQLPQGPARAEELQQERIALDHELYNRLEHNEVLRFYRQTILGDVDRTDDGPPDIAEASGSDRPSSNPYLPVALGREASLAQGIGLLRDLRTGRVEAIDPTFGYFHEIREAMVNNAHMLMEWDVRFDHIYELDRLSRLVDTAEGDVQRGPLESECQRIDKLLAELEPRRSYVFGGILTLLSSGMMLVFKNFNTEIVSALETVIRANLR